MHRVEINGEPATVETLAPALSSYGHFTAMQVRDGRVRGLDEHLTRLRESTLQLFAHDLDMELVRTWLRQAAAGEEALSVRVRIFSNALNWAAPGEPAAPEVLITTAAPSDPVFTPLRVRSVRYERTLPQVKHVGTFGLVHHFRETALAGFDDALFVDSLGRISEGSVWNVGFFDGDTVVWPNAPALPGISLLLVRKGLRELGIPSETREVRLADLPGFDAVFTTNSETIGQPITSVDGVELKTDPTRTQLIQDAYETNPWDPI